MLILGINIKPSSQDVKIVTPVGSPDSWGYSSKMSISCPSFLKSEYGGEDLRISIGTFMKSRSGALGSLDGGGSQERVSLYSSSET
jgi:hypothetical protein